MLGKLTAKRETVKALLFIDTTLLLVCVQRFALLPLLLLWFDDLLDSILWFDDLLDSILWFGDLLDSILWFGHLLDSILWFGHLNSRSLL